MATLSSSMVNVGISMILNDQFSSRAGRITDSYRKMMNQMSEMNRGISMSMGTALDRGVQAAKGMYSAYEKYANVQDTIFLVTKMTGTTMSEGNKLLSLVNEINKQTPVTAEQIASGAKYLAMAGNSMDNIQNMLGPISKLSSILGHEIGGKGGTADLLTNIMIGMDIPMSRVNEITDQIGVAVTSSNISLTDFAQTMQYAASTVRTLKIPFEDVATSVGMLGNMGIQGSRAGTELKNAYENIVKTIGGQKRGGQEALASIGLSPNDFKDAQGNMITLADAAAKIGEAFKKKGVTSMTEGILKSSFFYNVFGMRGKSAVTDLVDRYLKGAQDYYELRDSILRSDGWVERTNKERMETAAGIIATFKANWENFIITYGKTMAPMFNSLLIMLGRIIETLSKFMNNEWGKFIAKFISLAVIAKGLWALFKMGKSLLGGMLAPTVAFGGHINAASAGVSRMNAGLGGSVALLKQMGLIMAANNRMFTASQLGILAKGGLMQDAQGRLRWAATGAFASNYVAYRMLDAHNQATQRKPLTAAQRYQNRVAAFERKTGGKMGININTLRSSTGRELLSQSGRAGRWAVKGWGFGGNILQTALLFGAIELLTNLFSSNNNELQENTNALNNNTESNNLNDLILAREKAIVEAFSKALGKDSAFEKQTTLIIRDESGRQLGEGRIGDDIDISYYGIGSY